MPAAGSTYAQATDFFELVRIGTPSIAMGQVALLRAYGGFRSCSPQTATLGGSADEAGGVTIS